MDNVEFEEDDYDVYEDEYSEPEKRLSKLLCISVIVSLYCMIGDSLYFVSKLDGYLSGDDVSVIGAMLTLSIMGPYLLVAWIGTILNMFGWLTNIRGLVLAAAILMCISIVLCVSYGYGLIPSVILSFVGYCRIRK